MRLFEQCRNTVVKVNCETLYFGTPQQLMDDICEYMNNFMTDEVEIKSHHVILELSTGENDKRRYVESITFQIFI